MKCTSNYVKHYAKQKSNAKQHTGQISCILPEFRVKVVMDGFLRFSSVLYRLPDHLLLDVYHRVIYFMSS